MKKIICLALCGLIILSLSACKSDMSEIEYPTEDSSEFTEDDMNLAFDALKAHFKEHYSGNTLKDVKYTGDEFSALYQIWADSNDGDKVMVFTSTVEVGEKNKNEHLEKNSTYEDMLWILVRKTDGQWQCIDSQI